MSNTSVETILAEVNRQLEIAGELPAEVQLAIGKLLNVIEAISADKQQLADELKRLRELLEQKKKGKTTGDDDAGSKKKDHSSEKQRRQPPLLSSASDLPDPKPITIHETRRVSVDVSTLPADATLVEIKSVVVQDIVIRPNNIQFELEVYYSPSMRRYYRAELPPGLDRGEFSGTLQALLIALKYSGNMTEPKIRELLENFDVRISAGSVSKILTNTANEFAPELDDMVRAGLESTPYQQTDDTSARVAGKFWHTHILCNPFYTAYFTKPHKDRLSVLEVLQNTEDLKFLLNSETLKLLAQEFNLPKKWHEQLAALGDQTHDRQSLKQLLDDWFGSRHQQLRTSIEHAMAIVYYRHQMSMPVVKTIVCDDAGQFKLLTENLALCWIHQGRHYMRLTPVVPQHRELLSAFQIRFWEYYRKLLVYGLFPSADSAERLRAEFDELFSAKTGYADLDKLIAATASKRRELLTLLHEVGTPPHNNRSELGARVSARRRDVSLHSVSRRGARAMDTFTSLTQTCRKLLVQPYRYFQDRLNRTFAIPPLASLIQSAAATSCSLA
jgi:hypothetical protein